MDEKMSQALLSLQDKIKLLAQVLSAHRIKSAENLIYHTTPPLNAIAKYFYIAINQRELIQSINASFDLRIPFLILGSGTKTLVKQIDNKTLIIKNRTSQMKVGAVKGKVGRAGIGVEEAIVEVDSGVSLSKLNQFIEEQHLQKLTGLMFPNGTIGGSLFSEENLRDKIERINVWEEGDEFSISLENLQSEQVILSVVLRIKA